MARLRLRRRLRVICVLALVPVLSPSDAGARQVDVVVDLRTAPSWLVEDASRIAPVDDVNGDGTPDAALSACGVDDRAGEVRVAWGPFEPGTVGFDDVDGFSILGAEPDDFACRLSMRPVGDVNGDGLADVLVGADRHRRSPATVYVVFGKPDSETVFLRDFDEGTQGGQGYVVYRSGGGIEVEGLGDMNEDGLGDFAVGDRTRTYVVFGQSSTLPVDLRTFELGTHADRGFVITNRCRECIFGAVGDVNGDDVPDVAVGGVAWRRYEALGSAYVVFGKSDGLPVDTSKRTPQLFKIKGDTPGGFGGGALSAAGDVNGDGLGDLIAAMSLVSSCCQGKAAVIFGKTDTATVRMAELGDGGFTMGASEGFDFFGYAATGIGDVNGDGLSDVAIGDPGHDYDDRGAGAVVVVYGKEDRSRVWTDALDYDEGYVIAGRDHVDWTGSDVASPGDMNGDGVPDLMISAPTGGKAYLLWL